MGVRSGKSSVADLAVQVFGRAVHPDWFAVREHRRFTRTNWEADVRIIDGGHAVTWRSGPIRLTEVLSGPETPLPESGLLYQSAVRHEQSTSLRPGLEVCYQACFGTERVDAEVFSHLNDELTLDAGKGALFYRFAPSNRMNSAPLSRIQVESRARGLSVQAFHTFPDEQAIVRVVSLFECLPLR